MGVQEHGKARTIPVTDLQAGMKVHSEVIGYGDKVLIDAGEVITRKHVNQIKKWENRPKPAHGKAIPKLNLKDPHERVRHEAWQGGWRPSDFNPRGVLVTNTLASGDETPAVERDVERSPLFQNAPTKSVNVPINIESPLIREMALKAEIKQLEATNSELGGNYVHDGAEAIGEKALTERRDAIAIDNKARIAKLRDGNGTESFPAQRIKKKYKSRRQPA